MYHSHIHPSLPDRSPAVEEMPAREAWPEPRLHSPLEPQIPAGSRELIPAPLQQPQNLTTRDKKATHPAADDSGYVLFATLRRTRKPKKWKLQSLPQSPLRTFREQKVLHRHARSMVQELPQTEPLENLQS